MDPKIKEIKIKELREQMDKEVQDFCTAAQELHYPLIKEK